MQKELSCNETEDIVMCLILRMGGPCGFPIRPIQYIGLAGPVISSNVIA